MQQGYHRTGPSKHQGPLAANPSILQAVLFFLFTENTQHSLSVSLLLSFHISCRHAAANS